MGIDKALSQPVLNRLRNVWISLDSGFELPDDVDAAAENFRSNFPQLGELGVLKLACFVPMCSFPFKLPDQ